MPSVFEHAENDPLKQDETDGMLEFMDELDRPTSTDWDAMVENPPHEGLEHVVMPHLAVIEKPKDEST